jgi:ADP-ribose pyrophosphatase YjhB (NUDIX family)
VSEPVWTPRVTVAALMVREGRFCLVEEEVGGELVYNQPAGHWERGETLTEACAREALEETAHRFSPTDLLGVYRWHCAAADATFLRFAFCGAVRGPEPGRVLDREIRRVLWLTPEEARALRPRHRSPLVMACIEDHLAGRRYPLDVLRHCE